VALVSSGNGVISCPQPHIRNDDRHRRWHAKRAIGLFVKKSAIAMGSHMIGFENTDNYNLGEKAEYHPTQQ
jgi:hypothetical protein